MDLVKHPIVVFAAVAFWVNQYLEKVVGIFLPVYHSYGDDLLAMPVVFAICLQVMRWIHPSGSQLVFTGRQLLVGLLYFSLVFELALPKLSPVYVSDPLDVLCYALGTWIFWRFINRPAPQSKRHVETESQ